MRYNGHRPLTLDSRHEESRLRGSAAEDGHRSICSQRLDESPEGVGLDKQEWLSGGTTVMSRASSAGQWVVEPAPAMSDVRSFVTDGLNAPDKAFATERALLEPHKAGVRHPGIGDRIDLVVMRRDFQQLGTLAQESAHEDLP